MSKDEPNLDKTRRSTTRGFSRYQRVKERKRVQARADARFYRAAFSLMGIITAFVFIVIFMVMNGGEILVGLAPLSEPWLGPLSKLEIGGFGFIAVLAGTYLWRIRSR